MSEETALVKDRLDIAEVVGEYVALKRAGRYFKGLCPFHQEKTPSFIVSPDKGIWHCFGACSEGGDVFSFVQKAEGLDFLAALKLLADRAGVELKRARLRQGSGGQSKRQRLFELLELTARFYHEILIRQAAGARARAYLNERGVGAETMAHFQLGYAPKAWDTLQNFLRHKGYSPQEMAAAGVVGESERGTVYDRFRGRVIFPVTDVQGRTVAFGGRIAPWYATGEEGKYINSPETELYQKRRTIYNLHRAKQHLRHGTPCVVVEGYLDVVLCVQSGVCNVVASSGTAFTPEATALLGRYSGELHLAFDADAAGWRAIVAATQVALQAGLRVAAVVLPAGRDPADLAQESVERLRAVLGRPRSLMTVLLERLRASREGADREGYLRDLLPLVAQVRNPVVQGEMVQELAEALHLPEQRVAALLSVAGGSSPAAVGGEVYSGRDVLTTEQYVLGLMLADEAARELLSALAPAFFLDQPAATLYKILHGMAEREAAFSRLSADDIIARLPAELVSFSQAVWQLSGERVEQSGRSAAVEARAALVLLRQRALGRQLAELQAHIVVASGKERSGLLRQFQQLTEQLAHDVRTT